MGLLGDDRLVYGFVVSWTTGRIAATSAETAANAQRAATGAGGADPTAGA